MPGTFFYEPPRPHGQTASIPLRSLSFRGQAPGNQRKSKSPHSSGFLKISPMRFVFSRRFISSSASSSPAGIPSGKPLLAHCQAGRHF